MTTQPALLPLYESGNISEKGQDERLTCVVAANCGFHEGLHPISHNHLLLRAKIMRCTRVVYDAETISPRVCVFIGDDFVTSDVDIAFDLCFLEDEAKHVPIKIMVP